MKTLLDFKKIEKISKALGDPYRLQIIELVKKYGTTCMQCSDIVDALTLSQPAISHHIKLLVEADLLLSEKEGRNVRYSINKDVFADYAQYLNTFMK
jgi:ArsR family transcriptional regulator, arsenate/arsenite/antimonite-responsive transcriptional repressor